jgi:hypothetical protein
MPIRRHAFFRSPLCQRRTDYSQSLFNFICRSALFTQ